MSVSLMAKEDCRGFGITIDKVVKKVTPSLKRVYT